MSAASSDFLDELVWSASGEGCRNRSIVEGSLRACSVFKADVAPFRFCKHKASGDVNGSFLSVRCAPAKKAVPFARANALASELWLKWPLRILTDDRVQLRQVDDGPHHVAASECEERTRAVKPESIEEHVRSLL